MYASYIHTCIFFLPTLKKCLTKFPVCCLHLRIIHFGFDILIICIPVYSVYSVYFSFFRHFYRLVLYQIDKFIAKVWQFYWRFGLFITFVLKIRTCSNAFNVMLLMSYFLLAIQWYNGRNNWNTHNTRDTRRYQAGRGKVRKFGKTDTVLSATMLTL